MGLNSLIYRYQKKLGTYDKQEWEKTVEQKIFSGLKHVPMRAAKIKTEFIDVDLVRGSSFPKTKPKHGIGTVTYLAIQRLLFLPFYVNWWIQQTSVRIYIFFLLLYNFQILNLYIYFNYYPKDDKPDIVSISEILIPTVMMLTLSMVHSQIISTSCGPKLGGKYEKKRSCRSRHGRSRVSKSKIKRNLCDNEKEKISETLTFEDHDSGDIKVPSTVKLAKKVVIESSTQPDASTEKSKEPTIIIENDVRRNSENSKSLVTCVIEKEIVVMNNEEKPQKDQSNVIQEDDGFESLNGNASSDNDREAGGLLEQTDVGNEMDEGEDKKLIKKEQPSAISVSKSSSKQADRRNGEDDYDSSSSKHLSIQSSREDRKEYESEEEGDCEETITNHILEGTSSTAEWFGVTTNSDDCSYSSEFEESDHQSEADVNQTNEFIESPFSFEFDLPSSYAILSSSCAPSDKVSCTIWTYRDVKKAELSVLDISSAIIARVESMPESMDYFYLGLILAVVLSLLPSLRRISDYLGAEPLNISNCSVLPEDFSLLSYEVFSDIVCKIINIGFGSAKWSRTTILLSAFERFVLASLLFFLLAVAERTFKQRFLYAKLFSHLTSARRARKSDLPHFRLNKVRNIKTWLSIRSYLKKRGPQRSVDVIVSSVFIITLALLSYVSLELIKDIDNLHSHYNTEALIWSFALGIFILRFMTLGTKINKKYRNLSVLITEQINLYLQIEQKPHKKEELTVANNVLKLAADLIKELESPFKISGFSANPYLYTITKVVLLSALSGVLSELLGFKLKLHKIKIK